MVFTPTPERQTCSRTKSNIGNQLCTVIIGMILITLVACTSDSETFVEPEPPRPTSVPEINTATTFDGPLVKAGETSVARYIRNGIYSATHDYAIYQRFETALPVTPTADNAASNFSTTNTQEAGVDEADRIKYNGDTLYIAAQSSWYEDQQQSARVRVLERQSDFSMAEAASLPLAEEYANIEGLYEHNNNLAILSNDQQFYYTLSSFAPEPWRPIDNKLSLDIYDTSVPASPVVKSRIKIDGTMLSSRRIGDYLYIVNGYTASVEGLNAQASTDKEQLDNYLAILDTPDSELMPKIYFDDAEGVTLNQPADCMIPQKASDKDGYSHLLTVVRINMTDLSDVNASCISTVAEVMYMSQQNLYLTSSLDNQTVLHKIALDADLTYQASGSVHGVIGWRSAPNLRLSEYDNNLRIVSSDYTSGEPEHKLSVLQQQGSQLNVVGELPNTDAPDPIGKPGEDIYAVRFFADRAYVVTFERIDPLYVIDLATPSAPAVLGALEIPGFSNYLHPLDNGYLLGVGQQVNPRDVPDNGELTTPPVTQEGMKVSLFDVTDPTDPTEVNSIIWEQSYTPVEYDYRALTVLNTNGNYKLALPVESWGESVVDTRRIWRSKNSLALLEVDTTALAPELIQRGELVVTPEPDQYIYGGQDRSVLHGEQIYYIHGNQVWHSTWVEGGELLGPY